MYDIQIQNIVASSAIAKAIDLYAIDDKFDNTDYDPKTECAMYADAERPERIELDPQRYCILFPGQMHMPGMTLDKTSRIVKVVVKVPYSE